MLAKEKPATLIWAMGQTQKSVGTANVRASCITLLLTGNVGASGTGANIFRGHTNVQGATDLGLDVTTLPLYYGLTETAWKHWARVWDVDYEWFRSRFDAVPAKAGRKPRAPKENMETPGLTSTRWFDAVLLPEDQIDQKNSLRALFVMGHGGNTIPRIPDAVTGVEKLDLLVIVDPSPTSFASMSERKNGTYLLPACTSLEMEGSRTASNRSLQWGEQIVKPVFESKNDYEILYRFAKKFGFADAMFKNIKVENNVPSAEDLLREINRGGWSTGYCGQSPERLQAHMRNQHRFDIKTLRAPKDDPEVGGDYYGLPWPCWGKPEIRHPGTAVLYDTSLHVKDGGSTFRARFGLERDGETLLAEGSYTKGSELTDGYPEFTMGVLTKLGWDKDLRPEELEIIRHIGGNAVDAVSWAIDLSGGIQRVCLDHGVMHYGNGKARTVAWNLPDPIPVHREPIYSPRPELVAKYPTRPDERQLRMPNIGFSVQKAAVERNIAKEFPIILTTGRVVEYEGGGEETRSNRWLAELQQDMFVEINTADAAERGIKEWEWVWVLGPENAAKTRVRALVTDRVGKGVAWMPFHFAGFYQGADLRGRYPQGADPIVLGESVNTVTTYGYDPVTNMHEGKVTLCQIRSA
jgi:formate dehydrogenase major subunit